MRLVGKWLIVCAIVVAASSAPVAAAKTVAAWTLYSYNSGGTNLTGSAASPLSNGLATFPFPSKSWAALLVTGGPTRNLTGASLSANIGVTVTSGSVFQYMCQTGGCGPGASVRLYVGTQQYSPFKVTSSNETDFWWSHAGATTLTTLESGDLTISDTLGNLSDWSDASGHSASDPQYTARFQSAIMHIQYTGLSFGGGNFFDNGVRIEGGTGSGSFRLMSFSQ